MVVEAIAVPWRPLVSYSVDLIILAWRRIKHRRRVCLLSNKSRRGLQMMVMKCISCLAIILFLLFTPSRWIHIFPTLRKRSKRI